MPHETREERLVKKEFEEITIEVFGPATAIHGMLLISFLHTARVDICREFTAEDAFFLSF